MPHLQATFTAGATRLSQPVQVQVTREGLQLELPAARLFWPHRQIARSRTNLPDQLVLRFGNTYQPDVLVLPEAELRAALQQVRAGAHYLPGSRTGCVSKAVGVVLLVILLLLAVALGAYFWLVPKLAALLVRQVPQKIEERLTEPMRQTLLRGETIDSSRTRLLQSFYRQLQVPTVYQVRVTVVQRNVKNAFALPGGAIVVYSALLDELQNAPELVALLGHETGHVQHRHTLITLAKDLSAQLLLRLLLQDMGGLTDLLLEHAALLERLAYSRSLELDADRFGVQVLQQNRLPPAAMLQLLSRLEETTDAADAGSFLSTHPSGKERTQAVRLLIHKLPQVSGAGPDSLAFYWQQLQAASADNIAR